MPAPTEIFISHSSQDHDFAARIAKILEDYGLPYWYSPRDILGAQEWHDEIGKALARCDWFILILSPDSVTSTWVKHELLYVLQEDQFRGRIVVIEYQPADHRKLSWTLRNYQWVSFRESFEGGCRELLRIWGKGYRGRAPDRPTISRCILLPVELFP